MNRTSLSFVLVAFVSTTVWITPELARAQQTDDVRNPFGVPDVNDPDGQDVKNFAAQVQLQGNDDDANAESWVAKASKGKFNSLDGEWYGRWNSGGGAWYEGKEPARIKTVGNRVYIYFVDHQGPFLIDTRRDKDRLIGRWQALNNPNDTGPCVFLIVSPERLDGDWAGRGRWDFRRKLEK